MSKVKELVVIGAGDTGREIINLVERINKVNEEWKIIGFVDDAEFEIDNLIEGYPVLGAVDWLNQIDKEIYAVCTIGNGLIKKKVVEKVVNKKVKFATLIDPTAQLHKGSTYGNGCLIYANTITSINVRLGNHVYISLMSTVGHDTEIGDYCSIYPGCNISGKVNTGECVEFGTGTKVIQGITIGKKTKIGAGAVVVKDLPESCVAVGCPAKPIKMF